MTRKKLSFLLTTLVLLVCIVLYLVQSNTMLFQQSKPQNHAFAGEDYLTRVLDYGTAELLADRSNVQEIVGKMKLPEEFIWETKTTTQTGGGEAVTLCVYGKKGDRAKAVLSDGSGVLQKTMVRRGERVTVARPDGQAYETAFSKRYEPFAQTGMGDLRFFLETDSDHIREAKIMTYEQQQVLYVSYEFPELEQTEIHYLSLNYGVALLAQTLYRGQVVSESQTLQFSTVVPEEAVTG